MRNNQFNRFARNNIPNRYVSCSCGAKAKLKISKNYPFGKKSKAVISKHYKCEKCNKIKLLDEKPKKGRR